MIRRVLVFLLVGGVFGRSVHQNYYKKFEWGYGKNDGPQVWGKHYPQCNGLSQSPIVLPTVFSDAPFLKRIEYHDWAEALKANLPAYIVNDGKFVTWRFNTTSSKVHPSISGSIFGQKERFLFEKNVVRVGCGENVARVGTGVAGSEHGMNGQFYPGEIQWYWYNSKFNSFEEASKSPGNIVITAGFFEVVNYENPLTNDYFDNLYKINGTRIPAVIPWQGEPYPPTFDKKNKCINCDYYFYEGSLTTPPCSEGALWHFYMETFKVSERQINLLRSLLSSETGEPLVNNIRYVQATNFRDVLQHREKAPEDYGLPRIPHPYSKGYPPAHTKVMPPIHQDKPLPNKQQSYKEDIKPPTYHEKTNKGKPSIPQPYQGVAYPPPSHQEGPYPPMPYPGIPYPSEAYQEFPHPPETYPEVHHLLQDYQEVPYPLQDYQEVPYPLQDYQEIPNPLQDYQEVPYPQQDYQEVPYPLQDYQEVPYPLQDYQEVPYPQQDYQEVPYPPEAYQEVPYPPEAYKEGLPYPKKAYQEVPYTPEDHQEGSYPQMPFSGAPFPPEYLQHVYRKETYPPEAQQKEVYPDLEVPFPYPEAYKEYLQKHHGKVPYPPGPYPLGLHHQHPRDGRLGFFNPFSMFTDLVEAVAGSSFNVAVSGSSASDGTSETSVEFGKNN